MQPNNKTVMLDKTESLCPICLKVIPAQVVVRGKEVYMEKQCPVHGAFSVYLWPDLEHYQWMRKLKMPTIRPHSPIQGQEGCPRDCGLCASHFRQPTLIEIEVTERCNLRCPVCFMSADAVRAAAFSDPSLKELEVKFKSVLAHTGPQTGIQLTGGEPTVRPDLPEIVRLGREVGFSAIEVNTNGLVIGRNPDYLQALAEAGISGIFLQFDSIRNTVYQQTRGQDLLEVKLKAIDNCRQAGVQVVLAMTVIEGVNHEQMGEVLQFALANRDVIAGIAYQPAFFSGRFDVGVSKRLTMGDVIFRLADQSQGLLQPYDFLPLGCSHPLCSSSTYLVEEQGILQAFTRSLTTQEYFDQFSPDSPQGSALADIVCQRCPSLDRGLSIVIMNYMDAMTIDLRKLRECSMIVCGKENRLIPFCAYQLTNVEGKKLSRFSTTGEAL